MRNPKIGQILWCKNGETVIVREVLEDKIAISYKGKIYLRPKEIIGRKLFFAKLKTQSNMKRTGSTIQRSKRKVIINGNCARTKTSLKSTLSGLPPGAIYFGSHKTSRSSIDPSNIPIEKRYEYRGKSKKHIDKQRKIEQYHGK